MLPLVDGRVALKQRPRMPRKGPGIAAIPAVGRRARGVARRFVRQTRGERNGWCKRPQPVAEVFGHSAAAEDGDQNFRPNGVESAFHIVGEEGGANVVFILLKFCGERAGGGVQGPDKRVCRRNAGSRAHLAWQQGTAAESCICYSIRHDAFTHFS